MKEILMTAQSQEKIFLPKRLGIASKSQLKTVDWGMRFRLLEKNLETLAMVSLINH